MADILFNKLLIEQLTPPIALFSSLQIVPAPSFPAHDTAHQERSGLAAQYDAMNVLDGRILHELRALAGAMSDARKSDKSIPELKIAVLRNRKRKKAKVASGTDAAGIAAEKPPA
jgi:hypothetical protein